MNAKDLLQTILPRVGITTEELQHFSDYYNDDYSSYGNEVYQDIKVRLVHLQNFTQNSFWNNRFFFLWRDFSKYDQIIDIGFSIPYLPLYLLENDALQDLPKLVYVDENETSKIVAETIMEELGFKADFITGNALDSKTWEGIKEFAQPVKKLFTAFETIEHFENPELFWKELSVYKGNDLILSLPIGDAIPSHNLVFSEEDQVSEYLKEYIVVKEIKVFESTQSAYKIYTAIGEIK